ncbi:RING finger protein 24 [Datura stramonium]|uniref:RING-type E3 ubiquitin transferase n=1 Tax=Datura stramonium TaxID=4076 RepID=A0ABS8SPX2_DATST|nr:RING finger protein 24 [Datura stramonium]
MDNAAGVTSGDLGASKDAQEKCTATNISLDVTISKGQTTLDHSTPSLIDVRNSKQTGTKSGVAEAWNSKQLATGREGIAAANIEKELKLNGSQLSYFLPLIKTISKSQPIILTNKKSFPIAPQMDCYKSNADNSTFNGTLEVATDSTPANVPRYGSTTESIDDYCDAEELAKIDCGHVYHLDCIKEWIKLNTSCPMCKRDALAILT